MATCSNGTTSSFNFYDSRNCTVDPTDENPHPTLTPRDGGSDMPGQCLALVAFNSLAFVCEGVSKKNAKIIPTLTSAASSTNPTPAAFPSASASASASAPIRNSSSLNLSSTATTSSPSTSNRSSKQVFQLVQLLALVLGRSSRQWQLLHSCFFCFRRWMRANYVRRDDAQSNPQPRSAHTPMLFESDAQESRG